MYPASILYNSSSITNSTVDEGDGSVGVDGRGCETSRLKCSSDAAPSSGGGFTLKPLLVKAAIKLALISARVIPLLSRAKTGLLGVVIIKPS